MPSRTVQAEVENGQLAALEIESAKMSRPLGFILKKCKTRPAGLKELIALLKEGRKG